MNIAVTSRQYLIVPLDELVGARPLLDQVDLAILSDNGVEPGSADWLPCGWLNADNTGKTTLGAGLLIGAGGGRVIPSGAHMVFVREHLTNGTMPVWKWTRLTVGMS